MKKLKIDFNSINLLTVEDLLDSLPDNFADLIIADPPYNQKIANWDYFKDEETYFDFMLNWLEKAYNKLKKNGSLYLFNNPINSALILPKLLNVGFKFQNWIIWYKKDGFKPTKKKYVSNQEVILFMTKSDSFQFNFDEIRTSYLSTNRMVHASQKGILKNGKRWFPNEKGKLCTDVWEITSERHKTKSNGKTVKLDHPTVKPRIMIERIIKASSSEGDIVLDLFSGSAMTSLVSFDLDRKFIACDSDPDYIIRAKKLLKERLENEI
jgi:site-specific DNA-methyltransferase (adenine-specific)